MLIRGLWTILLIDAEGYGNRSLSFLPRLRFKWFFCLELRQVKSFSTLRLRFRWALFLPANFYSFNFFYFSFILGERLTFSSSLKDRDSNFFNCAFWTRNFISNSTKILNFFLLSRSFEKMIALSGSTYSPHSLFWRFTENVENFRKNWIQIPHLFSIFPRRSSRLLSSSIFVRGNEHTHVIQRFEHPRLRRRELDEEFEERKLATVSDRHRDIYAYKASSYSIDIF